jgi:hypothetical protein
VKITEKLGAKTNLKGPATKVPPRLVLRQNTHSTTLPKFAKWLHKVHMGR